MDEDEFERLLSVLDDAWEEEVKTREVLTQVGTTLNNINNRMSHAVSDAAALLVMHAAKAAEEDAEYLEQINAPDDGTLSPLPKAYPGATLREDAARYFQADFTEEELSELPPF